MAVGIWSRVIGGATPEQCGAEAVTQSRQVRMLLARLVQDWNVAVTR